MADEFIAQACACQSLLNSIRGRPAFGKVSKSEKNRLHAILLRAKGIASADLAKLAESVKAAKFSQVDEDALLDIIADLASSSSNGAPATTLPTRTALQDWEALCNYLPASLWQKLGEGNIEEVIDFLLSLGLRHPTEPTMKIVVLSILCASDGFEKALGASQESKLALTKTVRNIFKQRVKQTLAPAVWIPTLPKMPQELRAQHPTIFAAAYTGEEPASCPISAIQMEQLKTATRMRVARKGTALDLGSLQQQAPSTVRRVRADHNGTDAGDAASVGIVEFGSSTFVAGPFAAAVGCTTPSTRNATVRLRTPAAACSAACLAGQCG